MGNEFQLTEAYLSQIIKKQTGINFSSYILKLRMEKANNFLKLGGITIKDIANKVGYTNTGTFRRAYKRQFGITPTQYYERN